MSLKRRRQVRCTLCTPDRWKGNASDRFKHKEAQLRREAKKEVQRVKKADK